MASKRRNTIGQVGTCSAVTHPGLNLMQVALRIIKDGGNQPLSPHEIAEIGKEKNLLRVPRGRTNGYLSQLIQSRLYNNSAYSDSPLVQRTSPGKYKARRVS